jgi:PAS domain S-box-containing protein
MSRMGDSGGGGGTTSPLSAAELRAVLDAVDDAVFVHAPDGEIIDVNEPAAEMFDQSRTELRGADVAAASSGIGPFTQENAEERVQRAARGEPQQFEWQAEDTDGDPFWVEVSLRRTTAGDEVRVIAVVRDIDDRKEVERQFGTLIDNLPGVVYRCRNETGWPMEFVGGQCEALTGYEAATVESGEVSWGADLIHPEDRERVEEAVETAVDDDDPFEITYRIRTAGGDERWVWERGRHVEAGDAGAELLEGFITDITRQRRYERRLEEQRDDLEVLNEVLRHDVRNDLQLIAAAVEELERAGATEDVIETLSETTDHAVELTTTAREMAEVMLSTEGELQRVDLRPALAGEIDDIRSAYPGAVVEPDGELPSVQVRANDLLESVFRNVLKNAIQHNDEPVPEVSVAATEAADTVTVRVADNGPGVPDDQKSEVFGKSEAGLESAGAGIGLYLVKTLVEGYGGDVRLEDNDPEGAVVVIELPRAD